MPPKCHWRARLDRFRSAALISLVADIPGMHYVRNMLVDNTLVFRSSHIVFFQSNGFGRREDANKIQALS